MTRARILLSTLAAVAALGLLVGGYLAVDRWDLFGFDGAWACDSFESKAEAQDSLDHEQRHHDQGSIKNLDPDGNGRACDGWNHKDYNGYLSRTRRPDEPTALTRKVARHFKAVTGETLLMDELLSDGDSQFLELSDPNKDDELEWTDVDQQLAEEYGVFSIRVAIRKAAIPDLLPLGPDGRPQEPDENGIYWDVEEDDETDTLWYSAVKPYGNVVLDWVSPAVGYPELDETFWKLDRILRRFER